MLRLCLHPWRGGRYATAPVVCAPDDMPVRGANGRARSSGTDLIEGIEQDLKVRYLPESCLAHCPYRTIAGHLTLAPNDGRLIGVQVRDSQFDRRSADAATGRRRQAPGRNNAGMAVDAARGLYQQRDCQSHAGGGCVIGAFRPVGIRCTHPARTRDRTGQELSDGGRGHASGGSVHSAGQTKQRNCGASDGLPTHQTGRDTMSADKRTAQTKVESEP